MRVLVGEPGKTGSLINGDAGIEPACGSRCGTLKDRNWMTGPFCKTQHY